MTLRLPFVLVMGLLVAMPVAAEDPPGNDAATAAADDETQPGPEAAAGPGEPEPSPAGDIGALLLPDPSQDPIRVPGPCDPLFHACFICPGGPEGDGKKPATVATDLGYLGFSVATGYDKGRFTNYAGFTIDKDGCDQ